MTAPSTQVTTLLTQFGLTTAAEELVPRLTQAGCPEAMPVLLEVFEAEAEARRQRRVTRLRRASRLPPGKTFATLDTGRLPGPVVQQLETLATGTFLETATNVLALLAFGLPGLGKSHALSAVGHALVEAGHSMLCAPAYALVQELLGANATSTCPAPSASSTSLRRFARRPGLRTAEPGRGGGAFHAARRALRAPLGDADEQLGLLIRWSLVRSQRGPPIKSITYGNSPNLSSHPCRHYVGTGRRLVTRLHRDISDRGAPPRRCRHR